MADENLIINLEPEEVAQPAPPAVTAEPSIRMMRRTDPIADRNPKRIKLEPKQEVPQPSTQAVTADPSIEIKEEKEEKCDIAINKDKLKADFGRYLDAVGKQNQDLTTERDFLLQQVQTEMSKCELLRQQLLEHQESHKLILDSAMEESTNRMQNMSVQIKELTHQLDQINEENTCAICLSPWEGQGNHRVVSLPCGHLFGKHCIFEHLAVNPRCPYCNKQAFRRAVRDIFGCRILPAP